MPSPPTEAPTRERLLDAAQAGINERGFAGTSIDQIIERAGVTKGTFFYHFKSKNELARALIERFAAADRAVLGESMARAERLAEDPLQQLLIFVGLMIEVPKSSTRRRSRAACSRPTASRAASSTTTPRA